LLAFTRNEGSAEKRAWVALQFASQAQNLHVNAAVENNLMHVPEQIEAIPLTEPKIEDHRIHIGVVEFMRHVLAAFRRQGVDAILLEVVYHHAPQDGVVLDCEDTRSAIAARA